MQKQKNVMNDFFLENGFYNIFIFQGIAHRKQQAAIQIRFLQPSNTIKNLITGL